MKKIALITIIAAGSIPSPESHSDETGSFYVEGALVHFIKPERKARDTPIIMLPGMHLSSYIFLTTPDGREGWAQHFARAGYEVYVVNDPRYDFSKGFSVDGFKEVPKKGAPTADPTAKQGWQGDIWRRWGFGNSQGDPYPDARFPTEHFDHFAKNYPYLANPRNSYSDAIAALMEMTGPAIIMPHSAAAPQALNAAINKPDSIVGFVLIEPTGPPTASDFPALSGKFMLGVYGDYIESRRQAGRKAGVESASALFSKNGGPSEVISLPDDLAIRGNSHLMMQDNNSEEIAGVIIRWLSDPKDNPERDDSATAENGRGGRGTRGGSGGRRSGSAIFAQLDSDGNGRLDIEELGKARRFKGIPSESLTKEFNTADRDGDGTITPSEFRNSFASGRRTAQ